jgi:hypothetical protein
VLHARRFARRAPRDVQRQEMLLGRMRPRRVGRALAIVHERLRVVRGKPCRKPEGEVLRVTQWLGAPPIGHPVAQVVRSVA